MPLYQSQPHHMPPETRTLTLNRYQRDNLLWLLQLLGYGGHGVAPFMFAHTGDWVGEIHNMLGAVGRPGGPTSFEPRRPNMTNEQLAERIRQWLNPPTPQVQSRVTS